MVTAKTLGQVIFTDVCGPLPLQSLSGKPYFITFSDAMYSFKEVALMENKIEALKCFKEFQANFERKFHCKAKLVYSDDWDEYKGMLHY